MSTIAGGDTISLAAGESLDLDPDNEPGPSHAGLRPRPGPSSARVTLKRSIEGSGGKPGKEEEYGHTRVPP